MELTGVIVRQTEPTDWVNSMVAVVKQHKIRICIDPRDLSKAIQRKHFPMMTIEEVVASMPQGKVFSVLDATSGYWQVELDIRAQLMRKRPFPCSGVQTSLIK